MTLKLITTTTNRSTRRYWICSSRRYVRYNRFLVNRIEDLMDPSFLLNWKNLLEENNNGKRGHPYRIPNSFITFLAKLRAMYSIPFRSLEGIAGIFARITAIATVCYTSIFQRIRKIVPDLESYDVKLVDSAIDSKDFKITIRGDYLGTKGNRKRIGWSKLHAVISINDVSAIAFAITDDHVDESREGRKIPQNIMGRVKRIFGYKGYGSKAIYNIFGENAIISQRKNASSKSRVSRSRAKIVRLIRKTSKNEWKDFVDYGKRWHVEIYFSCLERNMVEVIEAVRHDYIAQGMALKVQYCNILMEMTHSY